MMIDVGCELVRERGLAFDPPSLTYATVFDHIEQTRGVRLHRSQVHGRIWPNQGAFQLDVIVATIGEASPGSTTMADLAATLDSPLTPAEPDGEASDQTAGEPADSPAAENTALRSMIETVISDAVGASIRATDADRRFDLLAAAQALSTSGSATDPRLAETTTVNLQQRLASYEQSYRTIAEATELLPDPACGVEADDVYTLLARASSGLIEGARMVEVVDAELHEPFMVRGPDGEATTRDLASLGVSLLFDEVLGLAPDPWPVNPPATAPDRQPPTPGRTPPP